MNKKRKNWIATFDATLSDKFDHWSRLATAGNLIRRWSCLSHGYEYAVTTGKAYKSICKADVLAIDGAMARRVTWDVRSTMEYLND